MQPTEFYQSLIASIDDEDIHRVAGILARHVGEENKISLEELAKQAFGEFNASSDRKTREILETLTVDHRLPVCSNSGKPGRWLAKNEEEREAAARELEARGRNVLDRARALRLAIVPAKEMTRIRQPGLWR